MIKHLTYRAEPSRFANRVLIGVELLSSASEIIFEGEKLNEKGFLSLVALTEAVVLNETIIVQADMLPHSSGDSEHYDAATKELLAALEGANVIDDGDGSAANSLAHEISALVVPRSSGLRVVMVHGSYIYYETAGSVPEGLESTEDGLNYLLTERPSEAYDSNYRASLERYGGNKVLWDFRPPEWRLLANCHGIPYISDGLDAIRDSSPDSPTNIGIDLYKRLESLNGELFRHIKKYLGPTYVQMPSLLSLALADSGSPEDIVPAIIALRNRFAGFRKACTKLEFDLRVASNLADRIEIIRAIESAYETIRLKAEGTKRRMLLRVFDVVKKIGPLGMVSSALEQAKDYALEQDALLKVPGYYNLWEAGTEAENGWPALERVFGRRLAPDLIAKINELTGALYRQNQS